MHRPVRANGLGGLKVFGGESQIFPAGIEPPGFRKEIGRFYFPHQLH
jgi:hypothetical protein